MQPHLSILHILCKLNDMILYIRHTLGSFELKPENENFNPGNGELIGLKKAVTSN